MQRDPALPPSPQGGWSISIKPFENAVIVPPQVTETVLKTGVFTAEGNYCKRAAVWRREAPVTIQPEGVVGVEEFLAGRHVWGGVLYGHFGHFQMQSIARLWALGRIKGELDGVVFVTGVAKVTELRGYQADYIRFLIGDMPVTVIHKTTRVERLEVPGPGFGLGTLAVGTEVFRRYIRSNFANEIRAEGPESLFISRSQQGLMQGGFVGESVLDARMEAAGYQVFHPELFDIATQIARYKAARRIVGLDGSAFHLFAMVGRADQRVGLILRRKAARSSSLRQHITAFTEQSPYLIMALNEKENPEVLGKKHSILDLDIERIGGRMKAGGFLEPAAEWGPFSPAELEFVEAEWDRAKQKVNG